MELNLKDKVVFIAGSSRGIGKAIANAFAGEEAKIVITGRNDRFLNLTRDELFQAYSADNILCLMGDLGDTGFIRKALNKTLMEFGKLDIVIGNIGSGRGKLGYNLSDEDWDSLIRSNLLTNVKVMREAVPYLIDGGGGSIVFMASIAGVETLGAPIAYEAAKAALIAASKSLSRELSQYNIRVNCISPGNILFPDSTWDLKLKENRKSVMDYINNNVPIKRFGTPDEIANIAVFLASEKASFINGTCIIADGGQTRGF